MRLIRVRSSMLAVAALTMLRPPAADAQVRLLASNGIRTVVEALVPALQRASGTTVAVSYGLATALKKQIDEGQAFDVAILTPAALDDLIAQGRVDRASRV